MSSWSQSHSIMHLFLFLHLPLQRSEEKLNEMLLILKRQMQSWERNGQDEGGCDYYNEDDEF